MVSSDRTGGNVQKLKYRKFCLNIRRNFFTVRMVKQWNELPRKLHAWRFLKTGLYFVLGNESYSIPQKKTNKKTAVKLSLSQIVLNVFTREKAIPKKELNHFWSTLWLSWNETEDDGNEKERAIILAHRISSLVSQTEASLSFKRN